MNYVLYGSHLFLILIGPQNRLPIENQKQEFIRLLDDVKHRYECSRCANQNQPLMLLSFKLHWSEYITGTQGKDPGYDPLAFMVDEAHKRNIEFHAWINPYRITMNHTDINRLSNNHPAKQHPD